MTPRELNHLGSLRGIIRHPAEVESLRAALLDLEPGPVAEGIAAAVAWAEGRETWAPITGPEFAAEQPPTWAECSREHGEALAVLEGRREFGRPRRYAEAVEHTLLWLTAQTPEAPCDLPEAQT